MRTLLVLAALLAGVALGGGLANQWGAWRPCPVDGPNQAFRGPCFASDLQCECQYRVRRGADGGWPSAYGYEMSPTAEGR